jgi:hypothetical protein
LHPREETKKNYFVRGESKEKILQGKTKLAQITKVVNLFTFKIIYACKSGSTLATDNFKLKLFFFYFFYMESNE